LQANLSVMGHDKQHLGHLAEIMVRKGVTHAIVSPGSRNAPVIIVFAKNQKIKLTSIADERSAGFVAVGLAQQLREPVALVCTSGSAAVNYGPAISEAYYQKIPLLVITADRPVAWVDQGDGQTIRQENLFSNFIRRSYTLPENFYNPDAEWQFNRIVNEAIDRCRFPVPGPVHLNLPLSEPLYNLEEVDPSPDVRIIEMPQPRQVIDGQQLEELITRWNEARKKMILVGQFNPHEAPVEELARLANDPSVIVLTETTSNSKSDGFINCIDRVIEGLKGDEPDYTPDILLTLGGAVVSKKIKALLRKMNPQQHWHISPDPEAFHFDTYQSLTMTLFVDAIDFIRRFSEKSIPKQSNYRDLWLQRNYQRIAMHSSFLGQAGYSDLKVYKYLFDNIPDYSQIHLGNSTPVRYAQLFEHHRAYSFWSNRGTSGIDGCISTAAGAAMATSEIVTVITGDIGFFYDSNALWNLNLSPNLKIILINNGGGNIFRILPGPDKYQELEPYLETSHKYHARGIADNFGLNYFRADSLTELKTKLSEFYNESTKPALLEIVTPAVESAETLRKYFNYIIQ